MTDVSPFSSYRQFRPFRPDVDSLRHAAAERVRPGHGGLYSAEAWRLKSAISRAGMPALDRGTYLPALGGDGFECVLEVGADMMRLDYLVPGELRGGGVRGQVRGFSDQSRRRLMRLMAQLRPRGPVFFVTLTYADDTVAECGADAELLALKMERDRDTFFKRLYRRWPGASALWKLEFQVRKSGDFVGSLVPHLHLILFGVEPSVLLSSRDVYASLRRDAAKSADALLLQGWVKASWAGVVASGSSEHRRRGADVVELDSRRRAYSYIAKYAAKSLDVDFRTGRMWGVFNRAALPLGPVVRLLLNESEVVQLKRFLKRWLRGRGRSGCRYGRWLVNRPRGFGFVLLGLGLDALGGAAGVLGVGDDGRALVMLERLAEYFYSLACSSG